MDETQLIHDAFEAHNCSVTDVLPYTDNEYVAIMQGVIDLESFLSEQGRLMYCKDGQCVELSGFDGQSVVVEISEVR